MEPAEARYDREAQRILRTRRRGLTLIEVVAAIVILGSSVTAMLMARANNLGQLSDARRQMTARAIAQELIAEWRLAKVDLTAPASGSVEGEPGWSWRRSVESARLPGNLQGQDVRLEIIRVNDAANMELWSRSFHWIVRHDGAP